MNVAGLRFPRLGVEELDRIVDAARQATVDYDHVGSTLTDAALPRWSRVLGTGDAVFDDAVDRLRRWAPQCHLGARIHPPTARAEVGETVLIVLRAGPVEVVAPDRVVAVIDEPDRFGYAYGTLPGHPERGEESFVVTRAADGSVTATITVDAVPGTVAARLAAPVVRWLQRAAIRRYLEALA